METYLPNEIQTYILSFLNPEEKIICRFVCKLWDIILRSSNKSNLCEYSAKYNYLNILQWAIQKGYPITKKVYYYAAKNGNLEMLKWLRSKQYPWNFEVCRGAVRHHNFDIIKWARSEQYPWNHDACKSAEKSGNLEMLKWIIKEGCVYYNYGIGYTAAKKGNLVMVKWIMDHCHSYNMSIMNGAGAGGQLHILQYFYDRSNILIPGYVFYLAAKRNHQHIIEWGLKFPEFRNEMHDIILRVAILNDDLEQFKLLINKLNIDLTLNFNHLKFAAKKNSLNIINFYKENINIEWDCLITAQLAKHGNLELLKWAKEKGHEFDEYVSVYAAKYGYINILEWARENNLPFYSTVYIYAANLEVMKWAYKYKCPTKGYVISYAIHKGHLDIIQWAFKKNFPINKNDVCNMAAETGQIEILKWAKQNNFPWGPNVIMNAARNGHFNIVIWAIENGYPLNYPEYNKVCQYGWILPKHLEKYHEAEKRCIIS